MTKAESNSKKRSHPLPWIVGIILLLGITVLVGLYWNSTSRIERIEFNGYEYIEPEQLQKQVNIPIGVNPDSLNYSSIVHQIKEIRFVEKVEIKIRPGGTMVINISERRPIAMLINGSNVCYVDSNGVKLTLKSTNVPLVPLLYGFDVHPVSDTLNSKTFSKVSAFLRQLHKNPASNATISGLSWSEENGVVALTNNSGVKLIFGKGHFKKRLRNWEAFYAQVIRYKGLDQFQTVNLSFKGQIVTNENGNN